MVGTILFVLGVLIGTTAMVLAGGLDSSSPPASTSSYNLEDIYNRLDNGAAGAESTFQEPLSGPGPTGHTLNEIMEIVPAVDNGSGATAADVADGKTFWGLSNGAWGLQTGTDVRFVDNGDGTVTDLQTNLMWNKDANICGGLVMSYDITGCLGSTGGYTDWRLPDSREYCSLIDKRQLGVTPAALPEGHPFINVQTNYYYWSGDNWNCGTSVEVMHMSDGHSDSRPGSWPAGSYVWSVRDL